MYKRLNICLAVCWLFFFSAKAEKNGPELIPYDYIYDPAFKSVQLYRGNDPFSFPILYLNDPTPLTLEFDELLPWNTTESDLWIEIINCDYDWQPSQLMEMEFFDGFTQQRIFNFQRSMNTKVPYVHYLHTFPPEDLRFKRSGNYLLKVFRERNPEQLVITRRFIVAENRVHVEPGMGQSLSASQRLRVQRVDFEINHTGMPVLFNAADELKVVVMQNGRWDNARYDLKPGFIREGVLTYQFDSGTEFSGGNEFRQIDMRTFRFNAKGMQSVNAEDTVTRVLAVPDDPRLRNIYYSQPDLNGGFFIDVQEYPNEDFEADYALVKFMLRFSEPIRDGDLYLFARWTDWQCKDEYKLSYNAAKMRYETDVLLKQGFYDYEYVVLPKGASNVDEARLEGSHFETENYYTLLVYYISPTSRSHEIVGISHVNFYDR